MKNTSKTKFLLSIASLALIGSLFMGATAFAQEDQAQNGQGQPSDRGGQMTGNRAPGVVGTVSAISGNTLIVTSKGFGNDTTTKTYTVDATNATVTKDGSTSSLSNISVGDTVMVAGTINGTNITAKTICNGIGKNGKGPEGQPEQKAELGIQGDGKPVVGGSVTSVSGSTITITNKSNVTYSVDASNATIMKNGATSTISSIATGDNVIAQGTINNTFVTATTVIDNGIKQGAGTATTTNNGVGNGGQDNGNHRGGIIGGFFGSIGGFFQRLFGF